MIKVETTIEAITPEIAERMLERNIGNRAPNRGCVLKYSRDMLRGAWRMTGDTIKFDTDGLLVDGQNRLSAVVESGATISFLVVRGLEPDARKSTDIGAPRTMAHILNFEGEKNVTTLASIGRNGLLHEKGLLGKTGAAVILSNAEIIQFIADNPETRDATSFVVARRDLRVLLSPSVMGFMRFITLGIDPEKSDLFFSNIDVTPEKRDHPCRVLRESIHSARLAAKRNSSVSPTYRMAIGIKAWNAFFLGRSIALLRFNERETFPKFAGYEY